MAPVFWSFRVMVGTGFLMLALSWWGAWQLWRRGSVGSWTARGFVAMTFSGWIATVAGWYVTEIGRQPWLVQGVLTTAEAASAVPAAMVATTLALYLAVYIALLAAYVGTLFYLAAKSGDAAAHSPSEPVAQGGASLTPTTPAAVTLAT